jgi:arylsulfatase A-like enzyme
VDTLRADALGAYGAQPSPSPFLDELAAESVVFEHTVSQAPWTVPSVASLLSGLYPTSFMHRRHELEPIGDDGRLRRLPEALPWLPLRLKEAGYHTAAFQKNPLLRQGTRFERGFDVYEWVRGNTAEHESGAQLTDAILRWADAMAERRAEGRPGSFFLYAQFMDPHIEYRPPDEFLADLPKGYHGPVDGGTKSVRRVEEQPGGPTEADLAQIRGRYRGDVAYLDRELRRLHEGLTERGLLGERTVLVLVADHGEQFFEHGEFMHGDVHRENLHVPFLLRAPGLAPARIAAPVGLIDVAPTLAELLGLGPLPVAEGRSVLALARGEPLAAPPALSDGVRPDDARVTGPRYSLVRRRGVDRLYDLHADPGETRDLSGEAPEALAELREILARHDSRAPLVEPGEVEDAPVDEQTRELLEALGYVR